MLPRITIFRNGNDCNGGGVRARPGDLDKGSISPLKDILCGPVWQCRRVITYQSHAKFQGYNLPIQEVLLGISETFKNPFPFLKRRLFEM